MKSTLWIKPILWNRNNGVSLFRHVTGCRLDMHAITRCNRYDLRFLDINRPKSSHFSVQGVIADLSVSFDVR